MKKEIYIVTSNNITWYEEGDIVVKMPKPKGVAKNNFWVIGADQQKVLNENLEYNKIGMEDGSAIDKKHLTLLDTI